MHFDDGILIAGIILGPPRETREIVVPQDDDIHSVRCRDLLRIRDSFKGFDHDNDKHVVVDRRAIVDTRPCLPEGARRGNCGVRRGSVHEQLSNRYAYGLRRHYLREPPDRLLQLRNVRAQLRQSAVE